MPQTRRCALYERGGELSGRQHRQTIAFDEPARDGGRQLFTGHESDTGNRCVWQSAISQQPVVPKD
jgi:hypothetical protein